MNGVIVGGWEYVWTVYGVTWATLLVYGVTLYYRGRES